MRGKSFSRRPRTLASAVRTCADAPAAPSVSATTYNTRVTARIMSSSGPASIHAGRGVMMLASLRRVKKARLVQVPDVLHQRVRLREQVVGPFDGSRLEVEL